MEPQQDVHRFILYPTANPEPFDEYERGMRGGGGMRVCSHGARNVNRQSVQYLADFLQGDQQHPHEDITALELAGLTLSDPSDGGSQVLRSFFANQTTLSKVELWNCNFGSTEEASQIFASFETNISVSDLSIYGTVNLHDAALGTSISRVLQNAVHLQRLQLGHLNVETVRSLQPGLRSNRHLKILDLGGCRLRDEVLRLIVDALIGNTTMELLDISCNDITSNGLADITRLLESTHGVRKIDFRDNDGVFDDNTATQRFAHILSRNGFLTALAVTPYGSPAEMLIFQAIERNNVLESLNVHRPGDHGRGQLIDSLPRIKGLKQLIMNHGSFRHCIRNASFLPALHQNTSLEKFMGIKWNHINARIRFQIENILTRNLGLRRADLLLAPHQPRTLLPIAAKSGIWCMAFAKMTNNDGQNTDGETIYMDIYMDYPESSNESGSDYEEEDDDSAADDVTYSGASAIFKILQARPAILQPLLQRPTAAAANTSRTQSESSTTTLQQLPCSSSGGTNSSEAGAAAAAAAQRCNKRRRL